MESFSTIIHRFDKKGEKTGWTYIEIPADIANSLKPKNKMAFRVKGLLDDFPIAQVALIPMGEGVFILPLNASIRKGIRKKEGAMLLVKLEEDKSPLLLDSDFTMFWRMMNWRSLFKTLTKSHQQYFRNGLQVQKPKKQKQNELLMTINALSKQMGYPEMIRANKAKKLTSWCLL
ncbi:MAG: DUF1905 domain-containing protein [Bacteroidetes bacterium]|nr:DUF1905 domain-containing protein [Bacteroidota bacterium]